MQGGAGDMVHLNIPAEVVPEVTNDIGCGSNGAYVGPQIRMLVSERWYFFLQLRIGPTDLFMVVPRNDAIFLKLHTNRY